MKKSMFILILFLITAFIGSSCGGNASKDEAVKLSPPNFNQLPTNTPPSSNDVASYKEVNIGNQVWMIENLNVDKFRNGDPIPEARTAEEWYSAYSNKQPAWSYHGYNLTNGEKYGKLYNFFAVSDPRGLAPEGWHVPSEEEWGGLIDFLGGKAGAGKKMKSTDFWADWKGESGNGTNESGFSGLPGANQSATGIVYKLGFLGAWWSSTESGADDAWYCNIGYGDDAGWYKSKKEYGNSVRCIKD